MTKEDPVNRFLQKKLQQEGDCRGILCGTQALEEPLKSRRPKIHARIALMTEKIFSDAFLPHAKLKTSVNKLFQREISRRRASFRCASFRIVLRASPIVRKNPCYGRRMFFDLSVVLKIRADVRRLEFEGVFP